MYPNLRMALELKGITLDTLASVLDVHRNTVTNKLEGRSDFTYDEAVKICDMLLPEYRPSYLFKKMPTDSITN